MEDKHDEPISTEVKNIPFGGIDYEVVIEGGQYKIFKLLPRTGCGPIKVGVSSKQIINGVISEYKKTFESDS